MELKLIKNTFYKERVTKQNLCRFIAQTEKLSIGEQCRKAESKFAKYTGRKYCLLFNSGSSANLALIQAYLNLGKFKKGDAIGFSAVTWPTNVMPLIQLGLRPIPIDVNLETLNISSQTVLQILNKQKLNGIFITNVLGFSSDIDKIAEICDRKDILFFEDNCESFGSRYNNKLLGNFGHASTYSFFVGHHLSTIEGGSVCTDDWELYEILHLIRAHGWDRNLPAAQQRKIRKKYGIKSDFYGQYTFYDLGYNIRPTEITGFLLSENLKYADEIIKTRERNFKEIYFFIQRYCGDKYFPLNFNNMTTVSNFAIPLVCRSKNTFEKTLKKLQDMSIEVRPIISGNLIRQPFLKKHIGLYRLGDFPTADLIHKQGLYLGNNPDLTQKEISYIKKAFYGI